MALANAYLAQAKNLGAILDSIRSAQAPERFTTKFLENLGYKSAGRTGSGRSPFAKAEDVAANDVGNGVRGQAARQAETCNITASVRENAGAGFRQADCKFQPEPIGDAKQSGCEERD